MLLPYQLRVRKEKYELDTNIERLFLFVQSQQYADMDSDERTLMMQQLMAMRNYSRILGERIKSFQR